MIAIIDMLTRARICALMVLREYLRSGRILVETLVALCVAWIFFWPNGARRGLDTVWFFSMADVFVVLLTGYTALTVLTLGRRPEAALLVTRRLGRSGYIVGLFGAVVAISSGIYVLFSAVVLAIWYTRPHTLSFTGWVRGSLPLLLNGMIAAAFITLIAPLTMNNRPRLIILALVMLSIARDSELFGSGVGSVLHPFLFVVQLPLVPFLQGFAVAVAEPYLPFGAIVFGQLLVTMCLLGAAVVTFGHRSLCLRA